jgi:hypothetical protein
MMEQQLQHWTRAVPPGCDYQRNASLIGARLGIGTMFQQEPDFFRIVHGPHERRRAGIVVKLGISAIFEQQPDNGGAPVKRGVHQRRRSSRASPIRGLGIRSHQLPKGLAVSIAKRFEDGSRFGIEWRGCGFP